MKYQILLKPKIISGFWLGAKLLFDYLIYLNTTSILTKFVNIISRHFKYFQGLSFKIGGSKT